MTLVVDTERADVRRLMRSEKNDFSVNATGC